MRALTKEEEHDNEEFHRLARKITARDAKRGAQEAAHQVSNLYHFTMKEAGKGYGILKRRIFKHRNK